MILFDSIQLNDYLNGQDKIVKKKKKKMKKMSNFSFIREPTETTTTQSKRK